MKYNYRYSFERGTIAATAAKLTALLYNYTANYEAERIFTIEYIKAARLTLKVKTSERVIICSLQ